MSQQQKQKIVAFDADVLFRLSMPPDGLAPGEVPSHAPAAGMTKLFDDLRTSGCRVVVLGTHDRRPVKDALNCLGVDRPDAKFQSKDKAEAIARLNGHGDVIAYVGSSKLRVNGPDLKTVRAFIYYQAPFGGTDSPAVTEFLQSEASESHSQLAIGPSALRAALNDAGAFGRQKAPLRVSATTRSNGHSISTNPVIGFGPATLVRSGSKILVPRIAELFAELRAAGYRPVLIAESKPTADVADALRPLELSTDDSFVRTYKSDALNGLRRHGRKVLGYVGHDNWDVVEPIKAGHNAIILAHPASTVDQAKLADDALIVGAPLAIGLDALRLELAEIGVDFGRTTEPQGVEL